MAKTKSLRVRLCRAISTTVHSCRSKDTSDPPVVDTRSVRRSFAVSVPRKIQWLNEDEWRVLSKIFTPRRKIDAPSSNFHPPPPTAAVSTRKKRRHRKNTPRKPALHSSSSNGYYDGAGFRAAAEEETETETLVSSNFHNFNPKLHRKTRNRRRPILESETETTPARLSMFKKLLPCPLNSKVKESFAVVKRSADPYEDFKNSMIDMIVEKQMFDARDLEQLLQCFLSLNCRHFHGIIFQAFADILENLSPCHHVYKD